MDSGNSGSLQSSSGGDEDFDSPIHSLSALFSSSAAAGPTLPPPPLPSSSSVDAHHFFDYPSLSYLDSSTPLLPLHSSAAAAAPWSRPLLLPSSSSSSSNCAAAAAGQSSSVQAAAAPRSSKKRSRASRRAPTTVLTTDTSNFRAMVQEFTGIPSPPFAASPPFASSPFDLFHSTTTTAFRSSSGGLPPPSFFLRPFPQKVQSPSPTTATNPISFSSPPLPPLSTTNTTAANANSSIPTDNNSYQLPSHDLGLGGGQSQSLVSPQSSILNFHSHLQPSLLQANYALPAMPTSFAAKPHTMPLAESRANQLSGLPPELIASEAMRSRWLDGDDIDLAQLRPLIIGDYSGSQQRVDSSRNPNYSASGGLLKLSGENAPESATTTRGEGTVEPWIHSSE